MTAAKSSETTDVHRGSEFVVIGDPTVIHAQNFTSLFTQDVLLDLDEVDSSWFHHTPPGIHDSSAFSDVDTIPYVDDDYLSQDSSCDSLPVTVSPIFSQSTQFKEGCHKTNHGCLKTPQNVNANKFLKSPLFYGISPLAQSVGRGSNLRHSTPDHLTLSLGVTMGGHELSWTSSMATPVQGKSTDHSTKDIPHAEGSHSKTHKPTISKKLFHSQLLPANSEADDCGNGAKLDSVMSEPRSEDGGSFVEDCSLLEKTPLKFTLPFNGFSSTPHCTDMRNTDKTAVPSPVLMRTNLPTQPKGCSHSALDQERLLNKSISVTEAEVENPSVPAPLSCCDSEDTPKRPKRDYIPHAARNVMSDLQTDAPDCEKDVGLLKKPTECCPHRSFDDSIFIQHPSLDRNITHQENLSTTTTSSLSPKCHEAVPSCRPITIALESPATVSDNIQDCERVKRINSDVSATIDNDIPSASGCEELLEKDNSKLNPHKQLERRSINELQKQYVQLENMIVAEPVFSEDADLRLVPSMSLKEFLPSEVELPLGPCAVKVDGASVGTIGEKPCKRDGDRVVADESKAFSKTRIQNGTIFSSTNNEIPKVSSDTRATNLVSEVLDDQDDDIFLNICSYDCRTKIRNVEEEAPGLQDAETPAKLLVQQMESNILAQPGLDYKIIPLANGEAKTETEFKGFTSASGKSIKLSEVALEKARRLFKEDDSSALSHLEFNDGRSGRKPELPTQMDCIKAKNTRAEDKSQLIFSSELQLVLSNHQEKRLADCISKPNVKSDMFVKQHVGSSLVVSGKSSAIIFNENDPLTFSSEQNVLEKPAPTEGFTCKGFSTASGKPVAVSEAALKNAKSIFKEDDMLQLCTVEVNGAERSTNEKKGENQATAELSKNPAQPTCKGFSTASGKPVAVSEAALKNAKSIFREDDMLQLCTFEINSAERSTNEKKGEDQAAAELFKNPARPTCKGFSTAGGKPVLMSKAALDKAKTMFSEDVTLQLVNFDAWSEIPRRASGDLSAHPLNLNDGETRHENNGFPDLTNAENCNSTNCRGFSTASGKAVIFSKAALEKAQNVFKEDGLSQLLCTSSSAKRRTSTVEERKGFETADQASVNTLQERQNTDEALSSKKRYSSFDKAVVQPDVKLPVDASAATESVPAVLPTFSLASGRQVHISKTALEKAEKMFSDERLRADQNGPKMENISTSFTSLKNDSHLNDSLENVLVTMTENDDQTKDSDDAALSFCGFSTASGKRASVSADALERARASLASVARSITDSQECDNSQKFSAVPEPNAVSNENRNHIVSDLTRATDVQSVPRKSGSVFDSYKKRTFSTVNDCEEMVSKRTRQDVPSEPGTGRVSCGFSMASGKTVAVTKESLQAARNMFNDDENKELGIQVVPCSSFSGAGDGRLVPSPINDWTTLSEGFSPDTLDEAGTILTEKSYGLHSLLEVPSKVVEESHNEHLSSTQNEELSNEIMESTDALLADEMTLTPGKGEKRSSSWLSPIQGRPKKLFSYGDSSHSCTASPKNCTLDVNASNDLTIVNDDAKPFCWRSVPTKAVPLEIQQMRMLAVEEQLMSIAKRKRSKVSLVPGVLWRKKLVKESRLFLRNIVGGKRPRRACPNEATMLGVKTSTFKIRSFNAEDYQFLWEEHFADSHLDCAGIALESGSCLIFNDENMAGKKEFYRAFLDTPGVDSQLIDENWVFNHYRWIVWKLAAMEMSFPAVFGGRLLTPNEVMLQLHYRYNCEIDFSQRSALKKIMERDDTPAKTLVLCVVAVDEQFQNYDDSTLLDDNSASYVQTAKCIEVTDGWYCIKAIVDNPMTRLVKSGKICIGQKLVIHGAELIGSTEACTPLEAPPNLALKISANCCRRAKWDTKLGYFACPKPFPLPLTSFFPDGGLVGCIHVVVARIYPVQYLEKRNDGTSAVYSDRTNNKAALQFENKKSILMEKIFLDVQNKFDHEETKREQVSRHSFGKPSGLHDSIKDLVNGEEIYKALRNSADPSIIEQCLSCTQQTTLTNYKETLLANQRTKFEAEVQKAMEDEKEMGSVARNVIPFLKFRAVGTLPKDLQKNAGCLITLWRPSPDVYSLLKEGKALCVYYLMAESRSFSSMRQQELHLKSTKMTKLEEKNESDDISPTTFAPRKLTPLDSIGISGFSPQFNEIDVIGLVVHVGYQEQNKFDFVYLADINLNISVIKFWGGLKAFGLDNFLNSGAFVIASNIQWRGKIVSSDWNYLYATEFSTFSQHPKDECYKNALNQFQDSFENVTSFVETAKDKVIQTLTRNKLHQNASTPRQFHFGKPSSTSTPLAHSSGKNERMDTPPPSVEVVQQRLRQLSKYGTPPPLPNLISKNSSLLKSRYRPPAFVTNPKQVEP